MPLSKPALLLAACLAGCDAAPSAPVFPSGWAATEHVSESFGPTKATVESFFDGPNNRELVLNNNSEYDTMITDWRAGDEGKVYYIRTYGKPAVRHCEFWCTPDTPIACDAGDSLCQYDYNKSATFAQTATIDGKQTNLFKWHDNLGPIPMNQLYLYVTQSAPFVPVQMVRDVHPFGKEVGNVTIDFTDFRALGPLDPAMTGMFDLGPDAKYGCASPAPGDQCQSGARANAHAAVLRAVSK